MLLFRLLGSTEFNQRRAPCFFEGHSLPHIFCDSQIQVSGHLGVELSIQLVTSK